MIWSVNTFDEPYAVNSHAQNHCLLLSGWGLDCSIFEWLLPGLAQHFIVHTADIVSLHDEVDAGVLVDALAEEIEQPVMVIGWSMGGNIGLELAYRYPEKVTSLCLIGTTPSFIQRDTWPIGVHRDIYEGFHEGLIQDRVKTLKRFDFMQCAQDIEESSLRKAMKDYRAQQEMLSASELALGLDLLAEFDQRKTIKLIKQPMLWCFGGRDQLVNVYTSQQVLELAPQVELELFVDSGHLLFLTMTDQLFRSILRLNEKQARLCEKHKVAASFSKAAKTYDSSSSVQQETAAELLSEVGRIDGAVLDAGCGTAMWTTRLKAKADRVIALDFAEGMLNYGRSQYDNVDVWLCGDLEHLPLKDQSVNGIFSSFSVQWCKNIPAMLDEWERVLHTGGKVWLATLGSKTLGELKQSWSMVDDYNHVNQFLTVDALRGYVDGSPLLLKSIRVEEKVAAYDTVPELFRDLKNIGAQTIYNRKGDGLMGKKKFATMMEAYEDFRREDGKLPATYEVVFLTLEKSW